MKKSKQNEFVKQLVKNTYSNGLGVQAMNYTHQPTGTTVNVESPYMWKQQEEAKKKLMEMVKNG